MMAMLAERSTSQTRGVKIMTTQNATNETTRTLHSVLTSATAIIAIASTVGLTQFSRTYFVEAKSANSAKIHAMNLDGCPYYPSPVACLLKGEVR